ncbi:uncharacterized protein G2W53_000966 [Senna tora]|uniref:Uncharacterized protein n=1 Tax=Senna tora TaxID=362788 RepID=A0A835CI71_9FABA|nr:uncharacterized protein G2W53_000966 [Senna tora]
MSNEYASSPSSAGLAPGASIWNYRNKRSQKSSEYLSSISSSLSLLLSSGATIVSLSFMELLRASAGGVGSPSDAHLVLSVGGLSSLLILQCRPLSWFFLCFACSPLFPTPFLQCTVSSQSHHKLFAGEAVLRMRYRPSYRVAWPGKWKSGVLMKGLFLKDFSSFNMFFCFLRCDFFGGGTFVSCRHDFCKISRPAQQEGRYIQQTVGGFRMLFFV